MSASPVFLRESAPSATVAPASSSSRKFRTSKEAEEYFTANPTLVPQEQDIEPLVEEEFPLTTSKPTGKDAVDSICLHNPDNPNRLPYQVGQWVERPGNDQCWHLEPIRRIVQLDDGTYQYITKAGILVNAGEVRCSEEGVKREFGLRPHLWQQYALFRLEAQLRFQEHHEHDFMSTMYESAARSMWNDWLHHTRNQDFLALFQAKPEAMRDKLVHHMLAPFAAMDEVMYKWDMDGDVEASVFHYNSFFGSGWITSLIVLAIQLSVPFLILVYSARVSPRFPRFTMEENSSTVDFELIFSTSWEDFCDNHTPIDQLIMQYIILIVYLLRVFPVVYNTFYVTVGDSPELVSKLNSIRILAFVQGDDNVSMKCGYKLFAYMNSAYIAMVNLVLMFVLFLTNNTIDIILNALALEFVANFDKEVASKAWYDGSKRFFRAGVLEVMFLNSIALEHFETVNAFCNKYNVDPSVYRKHISGSIRDLKTARKDALNPEFMDLKTKVWRSMGYVAKKKRMREAVWQYQEQSTAFGVVDALFLWLVGGSAQQQIVRGIFNRYLDYSTWSKFEEALFLPPVPSTTMSAFTPQSEVLNFDPTSMSHPLIRFAKWLCAALMFSNVISGVRVAFRRSQYLLVPFMFFDGMFEWVTFVFILFCFPAGLVTYVYFVVNCQPLLTSTAQNPIFSADYAFGG
ncbi:hypothetical protein BASA81_008646 [Batrachochytrium salamandrivorans]|nr:hypothetical protein BASA81_008646 [Batrachochytrium salamandrivorans]